MTGPLGIPVILSLLVRNPGRTKTGAAGRSSGRAQAQRAGAAAGPRRSGRHTKKGAELDALLPASLCAVLASLPAVPTCNNLITGLLSLSKSHTPTYSVAALR
jgi:hypothetical protein